MEELEQEPDEVPRDESEAANPAEFASREDAPRQDDSPDLGLQDFWLGDLPTEYQDLRSVVQELNLSISAWNVDAKHQGAGSRVGRQVLESVAGCVRDVLSHLDELPEEAWSKQSISDLNHSCLSYESRVARALGRESTTG